MAERGANCLIIVAGHPTAVTNSTIAGLIDEASRGDFLADIWGAADGIAGVFEKKFIDLGAQKRKIVEGLRRTPGSVLPGRHRPLVESDAEPLIAILREQEIGTVFFLGGLPALEQLRFVTEAATKHNLPLATLGIPLSSENDVEAGDHTPGYGSAARFAASSIRDAARAAASGEDPLLVVEFLGSDSGWLAASTSLERDAHNSAPHVILVPEKPVDLEALTDELRRAYQKYGYAVAVTTEGAQDTNGTSLNGDALTDIMSKALGVTARCDKPGSLGRVAQSCISRADADEAYNLGSLAVRLAGDECSGYLVTVQRDSTTAEKGEKGYRAVEGTARLDQVPTGTRRLPAAYLTESGTQTSDAYIEWAKPLIGGALPEYISLG